MQIYNLDRKMEGLVKGWILDGENYQEMDESYDPVKVLICVVEYCEISALKMMYDKETFGVILKRQYDIFRFIHEKYNVKNDLYTLVINPGFQCYPYYLIERVVENGLNDIFTYMVKKGYSCNVSSVVFDTMIDLGRLEMIKTLFSTLSKDEICHKIKACNYYAIFWSFKYRYLDQFFYLCHMADLKQHELDTCMANRLYFKEDWDEYHNLVLLIYNMNAFYNRYELFDMNCMYLCFGYVSKK